MNRLGAANAREQRHHKNRVTQLLGTDFGRAAATTPDAHLEGFVFRHTQQGRLFEEIFELGCHPTCHTILICDPWFQSPHQLDLLEYFIQMACASCPNLATVRIVSKNYNRATVINAVNAATPATHRINPIVHYDKRLHDRKVIFFLPNNQSVVYKLGKGLDVYKKEDVQNFPNQPTQWHMMQTEIDVLHPY